MEAFVFAFATGADWDQPAHPCSLVMICSVPYSVSNIRISIPLSDKSKLKILRWISPFYEFSIKRRLWDDISCCFKTSQSNWIMAKIIITTCLYKYKGIRCTISGDDSSSCSNKEISVMQNLFFFQGHTSLRGRLFQTDIETIFYRNIETKPYNQFHIYVNVCKEIYFILVLQAEFSWLIDL